MDRISPEHVSRRCVAFTVMFFFGGLSLLGADKKVAAKKSLDVVFILARLHEIPKAVDKVKAAEAVEKALKELPAVVVAGKLVRRDGDGEEDVDVARVVLVTFDSAKVDVGDIAKTIAGVPTPGAPPHHDAATLILGAKVPKAKQNKKLKKTLAKVKGVKGGVALEKEVWVGLDEKNGGARLAEIIKSLKSAGIIVRRQEEVP